MIEGRIEEDAGGDIGVVFDTKEISGTAFVDVFLFFGVQIEFAGIAVVVCPFVGAQAGGIVASHLETAGAVRSCAVELAGDHIVCCGKSTLEVRTYGGDEDDEQIFVGGANAHLCAGTDEQRTDGKVLAPLS